MDKSKFSDISPGSIQSFHEPGNPIPQHAFIPSDLPPTWSFPDRLWPLLAEAKQNVGILEGMGRNLPNPTILLRPIFTRESLLSSRLEGTYATARELLLFELEPAESEKESDKTNEHREVFNYQRALEYGTKSELPLSLRLIRDFHRILMSGVRGKDKTPGEFRDGQVAIGTDRRFVPPPHTFTKELLYAFENYMNSPSAQFDPLVNCFLVHYQFETIHPFWDGNGRVGRLLLAIMICRLCGLTKPWLCMSEYYEESREQYAELLFNVSAKAQWGQWIEFSLKGALRQAKETIGRCEKLQKIKEDLRARLKQTSGNVRLNQIVDGLFNSPFVRIADLPSLLDITYPTAKSDIERLVDVGILHELSNATPRTHYCRDIFRVAFEKLEDSE